MVSLDKLLDEAELAWRKSLGEFYPQYSDIPVDKTKQKNAPMDFGFATNVHSAMLPDEQEGRTIFASVNKEGPLKRKISRTVERYWRGSTEELAREMFKFGFFHESMHHIDVPGKDEQDEIAILAAMRKGITKAIPNISEVDLLDKIGSSWNIIYDFVINTRLEYENRELNRNYYRKDIMPMAYFLGQNESNFNNTNILSILALTYGLLYGPRITHHFFEKKAGGRHANDVATQAISALLNETKIYLKSYRPTILDRLKLAVGYLEPEETSITQYHTYYNNKIREVLESPDRYGAVERFMTVLAPYITKNLSKEGDVSRKGNGGGGGQGKQGGGSGEKGQKGSGDGSQKNDGQNDGSEPSKGQKTDGKKETKSGDHQFQPGMPIDDLIDKILAGMDEKEKKEFMEGLAKTANERFKELADSLAKQGTEEHENISNLNYLVMHNYYKNNHFDFVLLGPKQLSALETIGNRITWKVKSQEFVSEARYRTLSNSFISYLANMAKLTKLPWVRHISDGYIITLYEADQTSIKGRVPMDSILNLPELFEFYLDCSTSMFRSESRENFTPGDNSKWDNLCKVTYGLMSALIEAERYIGKPSNVRITNFSGNNKTSQVIDAKSFWEGDPNALRIMFYFNRKSGEEGTVLNIYTSKNAPNTAYFIGTDGELSYGREHEEREAKKIGQLASDKNNRIMYFEMGGTYGLGKRVEKMANVAYKSVTNKTISSLLKEGIPVFFHKN